jgi:hypothetical protein
VKFTDVFNIKLLLGGGTLGLAVRLFGLDFSVMLLGSYTDWGLVELHLLTSWRVILYLQVWLVSVWVGRSEELYG